MPQITITIQIPEGATIAVRNEGDELTNRVDASERGREHDDGFTSALEWAEKHTPASQQRVHRDLLERLQSEFDLVGSRPSTGSRPYLNFYPEARYGTGRVGGLTLKTSRFYAVLNPDLVDQFPGTEAAEGRYLTCYISEPERIDLAVSLIRHALRERGWEDSRP